MKLFSKKAYTGHSVRLNGSDGRLTRIGVGILNAGDRAGRVGIQAISSCRTGIASLRTQIVAAGRTAGRLKRSGVSAMQDISGGVKKSTRMVRKSARVMQKSVKKARKEFK